MQTDSDKVLLAYFTDVEYLLDTFKNCVAAPTLPKRILVIHGVGGVGKSSLLRMFRLHCKSVNVPVALASGDEQKSAFDVLARWTEDLKADGVAFPTFGKTYEHYCAIQAKVDTESQKARGKMADLAGKAAGKTAETVAAATVGAALGSIIPGIGTIAGVLGGMGAEALVDWLRGFLRQPDIDLLLDPAKKLTDDFLADVAPAADKRRIVLMLDTFEQMTALDDWARDVAQRLHANALLVIAGRALPNWSRAWDGWMANAQVEELKPMTEEVMRELVGRYYATMRGGEPNPAQVEAIIRFARGLPIVVTSVVRLWIKYPDSVGDLNAVKPEVIADLVDLLMEGVPKDLIPTLEAAAIVRWFDQPILRAVTGLADVRDVYNELRRFPFVRVRVEGLALHDAVREIMDENLRAQDSERHCELHERAAAYFEKRLEKVTGEEAERLGLERLYHRVRADEEAGIKLFQEMAEELTRYRLVNRLRALLNDANTYPLERENSRLWKGYYSARLLHLQAHLSEAEQLYRSIGNDEKSEPRLRAYALCSLGIILSRWRRLGKTSKIDTVVDTLERSLQLGGQDPYLFTSIINLAHVYDYLEDWDKAIIFHDKAIELFKAHGDYYRLIDAYSRKRVYYAQRGEWKEMFQVDKLGQLVLPRLSEHSYFHARFLGWSNWAWAFAGRYAEGEKRVRGELDFVERFEDRESLADFYRDLALLLARQDRLSEAIYYSDEGIKVFESLEDYRVKSAFAFSHRGMILTRCGQWDEAEKFFIDGLNILETSRMIQDIPELLAFWGQLYELKEDWDKAINSYNRCLGLKKTRRLYCECAALAGLVRVKHAQGDYVAIPPLLAEAEQLAQQYEYNDHLASLRLTQAHIAWEGHIADWGNGFDATLRYYQHALIYALRYNRFLLDEVLSGRPHGTPLRPIIPYCLARGEEGRRMLTALRDWWKTGVNDIGTPRPDTISPIPEGIPLLEAERLAREREPGDRSPQKSVVEQIEAAL